MLLIKFPRESRLLEQTCFIPVFKQQSFFKVRTIAGQPNELLDSCFPGAKISLKSTDPLSLNYNTVAAAVVAYLGRCGVALDCCADDPLDG